MPDLLKKLYIEPTSRCNLRCTMCFRKAWFDEPLADMDMAVFYKTLATMPQSVEHIFFGGMGEPLAHEHILEMVEAAASNGKTVSLITNAMLLTPKMSASLLAAGLDNLWVSIDSFQDTHYGSIRENSTLALVRQHLGLFNLELDKYQRDTPRPVSLNLAFVLMKSNLQQLPALPAFTTKYHISDVNISHVIPTDEATLGEVLYDRVIEWGLGTPKKAPTKIHLPLMNWRQDGVMQNLQDILCASGSEVYISGQPLSREHRHCRFVEEGNAFVKHNGEVSPCMGLLHSSKVYWGSQERIIHHHSFGNVLQTGLEDIWESHAYCQFREKVRRFEFSPCFRCTPCDNWPENKADCFGNTKPTCGACLWAEGLISCP